MEEERERKRGKKRKNTLDRTQSFLADTRVLMMLLLVLLCLHLVFGAPCSTLTDPDENATAAVLTTPGIGPWGEATLDPLTCGESEVVCEDDSGTCHVTSIINGRIFSVSSCNGLVNFSLPMLRTVSTSQFLM